MYKGMGTDRDPLDTNSSRQSVITPTWLRVWVIFKHPPKRAAVIGLLARYFSRLKEEVFGALQIEG